MSSNTNQDDVPVVCEKCLGTNPYLKMLRERNGLECKLCTRPFTLFKWAPEKNGALKNTIICVTCARQRNCCQSCLLDLTYGIPIQLRDAALKMAGVEGLSNTVEPSNVISKLYIANNEEKFEKLGGAAITSNADKAKDILSKLALATKNKAPKAHKEKPNSLPQHIEKTDVTKIVAKLPFNGSLEPPEKDKSLATLFIFGIDESLPEYKITDYFEQFGKVKSFQCQHRARCGFLTYQKRDDALKAVNAIKANQKTEDDGKPGLLIIENIPVRVAWGKERPLGATNGEKLKLGSIVGKVMKKLTKTQKESTLQDKVDKKRRVTIDEETSTNKKVALVERGQSQYKSLSKDYEL